MTVRRMEAQAILSAKDATAGVFAQVAAKMKALTGASRAMMGVNATVMRGMAGTSAAMMAAGARFVAPAALALGAQRSLKTFADLETGVTKLGVTAEATDEQIRDAMNAFRAQAPGLGVTAREMGDAAQVFSAAGLDFETSVRSVVPAVRAAKAAGGEVRDLADAGTVAIQRFQFVPETLERAYELMAAGAKMGRVELKDMARLMATAGVQARRLGLAGEHGLAKTVVSLEILREGVGTAEEAANRWDNVVNKVFANETQRNFRKFGVNLEKAIKDGAAKGKDALDVVLEEVERITGGDQFKIAKLFPDAQANQGITILLANLKRLREETEALKRSSAGIIGRDFERMSKTAAESWKSLASAMDRAAGLIGEKLAPAAKDIAESAKRALDEAAKGQSIFTAPETVSHNVDAARGNVSGIPGTRRTTAQNIGLGIERVVDSLFVSDAEVRKAISDKIAEGIAKDLAELRNIDTSISMPGMGMPGLTAGIAKGIRDRLFWQKRFKTAWDGGGVFSPERAGKEGGGWTGAAGPIGIAPTLGGGASFRPIVGDTQKGPAGGVGAPTFPDKIEATVKPDQIQATLTGSAEVRGEVVVRNIVEAGSELIRVVEGVKSAVAQMRGMLNAAGPGSTGRSSSDAEAAPAPAPSLGEMAAP